MHKKSVWLASLPKSSLLSHFSKRQGFTKLSEGVRGILSHFFPASSLLSRRQPLTEVKHILNMVSKVGEGGDSSPHPLVMEHFAISGDFFDYHDSVGSVAAGI